MGQYFFREVGPNSTYMCIHTTAKFGSDKKNCVLLAETPLSATNTWIIPLPLRAIHHEVVLGDTQTALFTSFR